MDNEAIEHGARDFIVKTFQADRILATLRKMESPITAILNAVLTSIHELVPIEIEKSCTISAPLVQIDHGVLVGLIGIIKGSLFIVGEQVTFSKTGLVTHGVELLGDMLESFVGEFGNSVAGHTTTRLYHQGITIDIAPPTIIQGQVKFGGFLMAIQVPFRMPNRWRGQLTLTVEGI